MEIIKINENKMVYKDLLLLADPDEESLKSYLEEGDLYLGFKDNEVVTVAVMLKVSDTVCELKNIATRPEKQKQGYGRTMISYLIDTYGHYKTMLVGTGNSSLSNIKFYQDRGFVYVNKIENYFLERYKDPIYENGVQCVDLLYFALDLEHI